MFERYESATTGDCLGATADGEDFLVDPMATINPGDLVRIEFAPRGLWMPLIERSTGGQSVTKIFLSRSEVKGRDVIWVGVTVPPSVYAIPVEDIEAMHRICRPTGAELCAREENREAFALIEHFKKGEAMQPISPGYMPGMPVAFASGLYQMIDATRRAYVKAGDNPNDFTVQAAAGAKLTADNIKGLRRVLGTEPTAGETYLAHLYGLGKATALVTADPDASLSDFLNAEQIRNSNPRLKGKTVGDAIAWATATMQTNMEAVVAEKLFEGREVTPNLAGISMDTSIRLNAAVAAKEKQLAAAREKAQKEFTEAFSPLKPRKDRDPAGWVFNNGSPDVSRAALVAEKVLADPEAAPEVKAKAWQRALDMNLEEQMALGLSERETKALSNDQARTLVNKFQEAKGPDAVAMFYQTRDLAGVHFDKVYGELLDQGLPEKFAWLALLDPVSRPDQVNAISQVLNVERKVLKADLGPDSEADVRALFDGVESDYAPFRQAFEFGPFGASSKSVTAGMIEGAKDVALHHFRLTGDLGEAQDRARALLEDNIEVVVGANLSAVIPRETGLTAAEIEDATAFMQTRTQIDLFDPITIGVPEPESTGDLGELQTEFRRNRTRNAAKNYGVWTTNEQGDGLVLVLPAAHGSTAHIVLRNTDGAPYEIKFADVPDLAEKGRVAFAPIEGEAPQIRPDVPFIEGGLVQ